MFIIHKYKLLVNFIRLC